MCGLLGLFVLIFASCLIIPVSGDDCTTVTTTTTIIDGTKTHWRARHTELPSVTVNLYSHTVLVTTGYKRPPKPTFNDTGTTTCRLVSKTPSASTPAVQNPCPTTSTITQTTRALEKCTTTQITVPAPILVTHSRTVTATVTVPPHCGGDKYFSNKGGNGKGNLVFFAEYPYYPQTVRECCVACTVEYDDLVASAYISGSGSCECLVNVNGTYPGKSRHCPRGVEDYKFGPPHHRGIVLPGPCGK